MNIEGKRSGAGFVAHKAILVNALSRALAERVMLIDLTIGRKGFLNYVKAVGGSNVIKVAPSNGSASESQATKKRLRVVCGANTSYLDDLAWIGDKTPLTLCEIRVSPGNSVKPNLGATELAEALNRVVPFTSKDDARPVLQCVNFEVKEGKLYLVGADGFTLAVATLDYEDGEGKALVNRNDLKGLNALKRARRVRIGFEPNGSLEGKNLVVDTELIRYKLSSLDGSYPDWRRLIPADFKSFVSFDTVEAIKAANSLKVLADSKSYPVDLIIGNGRMVIADVEDKGQAEINAETDGEPIKVRIDGKYFAQAMRACGGMVDLKLANSYASMLFTANGYQLVVMPLMTADSSADMKRDGEAKAKEAEQARPEAETPSQVEAVAPTGAEPEAEQPEVEAGAPIEPEVEPVADKPKRKRKVREPVAVA